MRAVLWDMALLCWLLFFGIKIPCPSHTVLLVGELFAQAPVDQFPGIAVESVTDSSRYFVVRIEDGNGRGGFKLSSFLAPY